MGRILAMQRTVTMQKGLYKRSGLEGLFTDFKHHARSWRNSKRMRAKRERQWLKWASRDERNLMKLKKGDCYKV